MDRLHEAGYRALGLLELVDHMHQGLPFPERSFAITFDDGYRSVYEQAFPVLQRYGWSATVFLAVGTNGNRSESERLPSMCERPMLSWGEIREMQRYGITFGAHTLTHPDLTELSVDRINVEVRDSKGIIEDALSARVSSFAYPFGRYNKVCREIVSRYFACACSDKLGLTRAGSDVYALQRVDSYYLRTERLFSTMLTRLFPFYVWARAVPRQIRRFAQFRTG